MLYAREVAESLVQGLLVNACDIASQGCGETVVDVVLATEAHVCLWHLEGGREVELECSVFDITYASLLFLLREWAEV